MVAFMQPAPAMSILTEYAINHNNHANAHLCFPPGLLFYCLKISPTFDWPVSQFVAKKTESMTQNFKHTETKLHTNAKRIPGAAAQVDRVFPRSSNREAFCSAASTSSGRSSSWVSNRFMLAHRVRRFRSPGARQRPRDGRDATLPRLLNTQCTDPLEGVTSQNQVATFFCRPEPVTTTSGDGIGPCDNRNLKKSKNLGTL